MAVDDTGAAACADEASPGSAADAAPDASAWVARAAASFVASAGVRALADAAWRAWGGRFGAWDDDRVQLLLSHAPSLAHAVAATALLARSVMMFPGGPAAAARAMARDMEGAQLGSAADLLFSVSAGYFAYDAVAMLRYYLRHDKSMLLHHAVVCAGCCIAVHTRLAQPFVLLSLLAEPNSIWLHARKVMRMLGIGTASAGHSGGNSRIASPGRLARAAYRTVVGLNLATFGVFRLLLHGAAMAATLRVAWAPQRLPRSLAAFGVMGGGATFFLNLMLLRSLLIADGWMRKPGRRGKTA